MEKIVVIGAGGHAKTVIDALELNCFEIVGLVDASSVQSRCLGYQVLGNDNLLASIFESGCITAAMGIGNVGLPKVRNKVYQYAKEVGYNFPVVRHPTAIIATSAKVVEGTLCAAGAIINPGADIGRLCIINTGAIVEHDAKVGDGVHIAPNATVLGAASVGENTFVGAGSVILQGICVGKNCIIGAGSVVTHDVEDNSVYVGVPGKVIKRRT